MRGTVLIVRPDDASTRGLALIVEEAGLDCVTASNASQAVGALQADAVDVVLCDPSLPDHGVRHVLVTARLRVPPVPVVVVSPRGDLQEAIDAFRFGACDYWVEPVHASALAEIGRLTLEARNRPPSIDALRERIADVGSERIVGSSAAIHDMLRLIRNVAAATSTVLLTGETGTGKELAARELHDASTRAKGPFVAVNCAALPETLLEGELFGHRRGAFTGATSDRTGYFESAEGGTLFLDEIGEMPLAVQAKLLRAIERKEIVPLGSTREIPVDVRLIAATNRDLAKDCADGRFRSDLYYRLGVVEIRVPSLRERKEDMPLLIDHFRRRFNQEFRRACSGLRPEALRAMIAYPWPGNVRELENVVQRVVLFSRHDEVRLDDLPERIAGLSDGAPLGEELRAGTRGYQKAHILRILGMVGGHRERAAKLLGINPATLYRKLNELGMHENGVPAAPSRQSESTLAD